MKRLSRKKYDKLVDECIENFNFAKVHSVMHFLGLEVTDEDQMIETILNLSEELFTLMQDLKKNQSCEVRKEGFTMSHYYGMISLGYLVDDVSAYRSSVKNTSYQGKKSLKEIMGFSDQDLKEFLNLINVNDD